MRLHTDTNSYISRVYCTLLDPSPHPKIIILCRALLLGECVVSQLSDTLFSVLSVVEA